MSRVDQALQILVEGCSEYDARMSDQAVALNKLGLWIQVREASAMEAPGKALFISEVKASLAAGQPGIVVTCVAMAESLPAAVNNAIGQWIGGVLPVLAVWREQHSCLARDNEITIKGGRFHRLSGPIIARNLEVADDPAPLERFSSCLIPTLQPKNFKLRVHWLEMFASRYRDGAVDATCRLNNRDWPAGKQVLMQQPAGWPPSQEIMQTCRQFQMLVPVDGDRQSIAMPTFFERLMGRA